MSGLDSRLHSSAPDGRDLADQAEEAEAHAAYARRIHHRQILHRTLVTFLYGVTTAGILTGSSDFGLTDACLLPLLGLPRLRTLYLAGNRITDRGLEQIGRLTGLEDLDLGATDITDLGLVHLQSLKRLKTLNVAATRVTPEGVKTLQKAMPGLEISLEIDPELEQKVKNWRMRNP